MMISMSASPDKLKQTVAKLGLDAQQKAVIPFVASTKGKDSLWTISTEGRTIREVRSLLDKNGIQFRTLEPRKNGISIHVYDPGSGLKGKVVQFAKVANGRISQLKGQGEFLGGDTRAEGKAAYRKVLQKAA
jgi:hypothetical protein